MTSWIKNIKQTAHLLLKVSNWRTVGQATPTNSRTVRPSLSTGIPQKQIRKTKSERMTIKSTLKEH